MDVADLQSDTCSRSTPRLTSNLGMSSKPRGEKRFTRSTFLLALVAWLSPGGSINLPSLPPSFPCLGGQPGMVHPKKAPLPQGHWARPKDGRSSSLTAPNGPAQQQVILTAWQETCFGLDQFATSGASPKALQETCTVMPDQRLAFLTCYRLGVNQPKKVRFCGPLTPAGWLLPQLLGFDEDPTGMCSAGGRGQSWKWGLHRDPRHGHGPWGSHRGRGFVQHHGPGKELHSATWQGKWVRGSPFLRPSSASV